MKYTINAGFLLMRFIIIRMHRMIGVFTNFSLSSSYRQDKSSKNRKIEALSTEAIVSTDQNPTGNMISRSPTMISLRRNIP